MEPGRAGRDRVAVVTGARQGLGRAVAQHLAGQEYALALLDVGSAATTEESVRAQGVPVLSVEVDVAAEAGVRAAAERVLDRFGQVDRPVRDAQERLGRDHRQHERDDRHGLPAGRSIAGGGIGRVSGRLADPGHRGIEAPGGRIRTPSRAHSALPGDR